MAKYDSLRKLERDRALWDFARRHTKLSQEEIGKVFKISRARVSKILKRMRESSVEVA